MGTTRQLSKAHHFIKIKSEENGAVMVKDWANERGGEIAGGWDTMIIVKGLDLKIICHLARLVDIMDWNGKQM